MNFTLINSRGFVRTFFVKEVAELYLIIEGGAIVTNAALDEIRVETNDFTFISD